MSLSPDPGPPSEPFEAREPGSEDGSDEPEVGDEPAADRELRATSDVVANDADARDVPAAPRSPIGRRIGWIVTATLVGYLVIYPVTELLITRLNPPPISSAIPDLSLGELIQLRSVQAFSGAWAFAFGASIGSFLNVLVYRQPRGLSVLTAPSRCPACGTKLQSRDNVPVVGWLRLGGRCRHCDVAISSRYPIVEAIVGLLFMGLVFIELTSGGTNLPVRRPNGYAGFVWTVFYPKWDLITLTVYHFHMLAMLTTWALMAIDDVRIPLRSLLTATIVAAAVPLAWTKIAVVPPGFVGTSLWPQQLPVIAASLAAGAGLGLVLAGLAAALRLATFRMAAAMLVLIGLSLGWQAVATIGLLSILVASLLQTLSRVRLPLAVVLAIVAALHHAFWRPLFDLLWSWSLPTP